jgi:hypothetical protein
VSTRPISLIRREGGVIVEARLYSEMEPADLLLVERSWTDDRNAVLRRHIEHGIPPERRPQSLHWDWSKKAPLLNRLEATGVGLEVDAAWQGLMLTRTALYTARLPADRGKPLVYIDFLESAPWNWHLPELGQAGKFQGIGATLFRVAVEQSLSEGFHGRVGLHSLPQSDGFYRQKVGMTEVARDPRKQNLMYFELSREQASEFLRGGAQNG